MTTTADWPPKEWNLILTEIGRLVFNWNGLEEMYKRLLGAVLEIEDTKCLIFTARMPLDGVSNALTALANEYLLDQKQEHILHCVEVFNRLREYRNYYIHSFSELFSDVYKTKDGEYVSLNPKAGFSSISAKKRFAVNKLQQDDKDIKRIAATLHEAHDYMTLVFLHFTRSDDKGFSNLDGSPYKSLPEKFPLPDKLQTNHLIDLIVKRPPQSSPK